MNFDVERKEEDENEKKKKRIEECPVEILRESYGEGKSLRSEQLLTWVHCRDHKYLPSKLHDARPVQ